MIDEPSYALEVCPTREKNQHFDFFFFFLLHAKNWQFFFLFGRVSSQNIWNVSDEKKKLPPVFIFYFFPSSDEGKKSMPGFMNHRIYWVLPYLVCSTAWSWIFVQWSFRTHFLYRYTYFYEEWMKFMKFTMLPKIIQKKPNMNLKKGVREFSLSIHTTIGITFRFSKSRRQIFKNATLQRPGL